MKENIRQAFSELEDLGATVRWWNENDGFPKGTAFVLVWADDMTINVFFDPSGKYIKEKFKDGRYVNPLGYRQDVHKIFARHKLVTDYFGNGQVVVYDSPDALGFNHAIECSRNA